MSDGLTTIYIFRWIGDVAVFRYEHFHGSLNGTPKGVRFESGDLLPMDGIISDHL